MANTEPEIRRTRSSFLRFSICIETKIENNRIVIILSTRYTTPWPIWMDTKR
jgi:hypothetical protein